MLSEFQRPKSLVRMGSMWAQSMAIAPDARSDRAEISDGVMPYWWPMRQVARRKASVTSVLVTVRHVPASLNAQSGVSSGQSLARRCRMSRPMDRTGQAVVEPEHAWPTTSPGWQFFWLVNVRVAKVAFMISVSDAVRRSSFRVPRNNAVSQKRKGREPSDAAVYSPGRHKKKKAR